MGVTRLTACAFIVCCVLLALISEATRQPRARKRNPGKTTREGGSSRCKDRTTFTLKASDLAKKPFRIKCPKGPIVAAQVLGVKGSCSGYSPLIQMNANRCAWNSTCFIPFMGKPLDTIVNGDNASCMGQSPDKLETSFTCLKKKAVVTDVMGQFLKTKKRAGVVRSHSLYPWSYRNGDRLGNVTFIKPRKPASLSTLWVTVQTMEILDTDIVFLSWIGQGNHSRSQTVQAVRQIIPQDTTFSVPDVSTITLTFYADYDVHHSVADGHEKGFILCYQWLKAKGTPRKGSACSKVMMLAKCKNKKGRSAGRRRSGKSRGRKSGRGRSGKRGGQ